MRRPWDRGRAPITENTGRREGKTAMITFRRQGQSNNGQQSPCFSFRCLRFSAWLGCRQPRPSLGSSARSQERPSTREPTPRQTNAPRNATPNTLATSSRLGSLSAKECVQKFNISSPSDGFVRGTLLFVFTSQTSLQLFSSWPSFSVTSAGPLGVVFHNVLFFFFFFSAFGLCAFCVLCRVLLLQQLAVDFPRSSGPVFFFPSVSFQKGGETASQNEKTERTSDSGGGAQAQSQQKEQVPTFSFLFLLSCLVGSGSQAADGRTWRTRAGVN